MPALNPTYSLATTHHQSFMLVPSPINIQSTPRLPQCLSFLRSIFSQVSPRPQLCMLVHSPIHNQATTLPLLFMALLCPLHSPVIIRPRPLTQVLNPTSSPVTNRLRPFHQTHGHLQPQFTTSSLLFPQHPQQCIRQVLQTPSIRLQTSPRQI